MTDAQLSISFRIGSLVRLTASFTRRPTQGEIDDGTAADADHLQPIDPDTVTAWVKPPTGPETVHAYLDSPSDIERDDVGTFHLDVTPDLAGLWYFGFDSTGNGQAANEFQFRVLPSNR